MAHSPLPTPKEERNTFYSRMTAEGIQGAHDKGIAALEVLAFLQEVLDSGGGNALNLSTDARAGLATILASIYDQVNEAVGPLGSLTTAE